MDIHTHRDLIDIFWTWIRSSHLKHGGPKRQMSLRPFESFWSPRNSPPDSVDSSRIISLPFIRNLFSQHICHRQWLRPLCSEVSGWRKASACSDLRGCGRQLGPRQHLLGQAVAFCTDPGAGTSTCDFSIFAVESEREPSGIPGAPWMGSGYCGVAGVETWFVQSWETTVVPQGTCALGGNQNAFARRESHGFEASFGLKCLHFVA